MASQTGKTGPQRLTTLGGFTCARKVMTELSEKDIYSPPMRAIHGILCVEIAMVFYAVQDAMMKSLLETYSVWMLIFFRALVSVIILSPIILWLGAPYRILTPLWPIHAVRGALFAVAFALFYAAFPFMGLAEVVTIFFSAPLFTAILAALWLKETIGPHRAGALIVGFIGILIAMNPTGDSFTWVALLPLGTAVMYAVSQVLARIIGDRETTLTVGLHTLFFSGLAILPFGWLVAQIVGGNPEFRHLDFNFFSQFWAGWDILIFMGAIGMVGYVLLGRAYQVAPASLIAPFDYTYLPIAVALGYFLFDEVPPQTTILGMGLIILSGLYLGYREIRALRKTEEPAIVAETTFVPGNPLPAQVTDEYEAPDQPGSR